MPERNVEEAKRLLEEAGLGGGFKTTLVSLNNTSVVDACQVVQAQLAEIGIEIEVQPTDSGTYWSLGHRVGRRLVEGYPDGLPGMDLRPRSEACDAVVRVQPGR